MMATILIVDDEKDIADLLATFLQNENLRVLTAYTGQDALNIITTETLDLAVLDVMLPDIDGFHILQEIRKRGLLFPVLMLTAKGEAIDKITGLTLGADDYITKPFNPLETVARVKTQLRRYQTYNTADSATSADTTTDIFEHNGLMIDKIHYKVTLYDEEIKITPIEFKILWYLAQHLGEVVSSETLFEEVWQEKFLDNNNTVMAHIARLREKMHEPPRQPKFIKTVWGVGYTIEK